MRVQSVVLEYHRDITVFCGDIIHELSIDIKLASGDVFKACYHTQ